METPVPEEKAEAQKVCRGFVLPSMAGRFQGFPEDKGDQRARLFFFFLRLTMYSKTKTKKCQNKVKISRNILIVYISKKNKGF